MISSFHQQEPCFTTTSRRRSTIVINGAHYYPTLRKLWRNCQIKSSKGHLLWALSSRKKKNKPIYLICSNNRLRRKCKRRIRKMWKMRMEMKFSRKMIREKMEFSGNPTKINSLRMLKKSSQRKTKWWRKKSHQKTLRINTNLNIWKKKSRKNITYPKYKRKIHSQS